MKVLDEHLINKGLGEALNLSVYQKFIRKEDLDVMASLLKENDIPFQAKEKQEVLDSVIIGTALTPNYWIEIENINFTKVTRLLETTAKDNLNTEDLETHHLNDLNDDELMDVVLNPEEWNAESILIAKIILDKRGVEINTAEVEKNVKARYEKIKEPKKGNRLWIAIWYIVGITSGILGILIGIVASIGMGAYYAMMKSTAPDGEKYYEFDKSTRNLGYFLMLTTIVCVIILFVLFAMGVSMFSAFLDGFLGIWW